MRLSQIARYGYPCALLLAALLATGCATPQRPDPLEALNRKTFAFNEGLDRHVLKPVAQAYQRHAPAPLRSGVSNVLSNLDDPWSGVNLFLQGRFKDGLSDLGRFGANTTFGLLGVMDVASDWGMPSHGESFNDTLRVWGVGGGAYLVLPLLGPSDLRGLAALPVNILGSAQSQIDSAGVRMALVATTILDKRANFLEATRLIDDLALDKYLFLRDAYLQRRVARDHPMSSKSDFQDVGR